MEARKISLMTCEIGESIVQYEGRIEKDVVPSVFGRRRYKGPVPRKVDL